VRQVTASGQTVDEAVQTALEQLNTTRDQVEIEVIDEGNKGIFGLFGSKPAVVNVTVQKNQVEETEKFILEVAKHMNIDVDIHTIVTDNHVTFELSGEKIAILIGRRGQTLNAFQYLIQLVINRSGEDFYRITLDAEGYRKRREDTLIRLAKRMGEKAIKLNRKVTLEPMPPYERKIIHQALQDEDVKTYSEGAEPNRNIVIEP